MGAGENVGKRGRGMARGRRWGGNREGGRAGDMVGAKKGLWSQVKNLGVITYIRAKF